MAIHLHMASYGEGDQVYFGIPGFGATHVKSFGPMLPLLPEHVTFYAIDPPGIGESPQPAAWDWDHVTDHMVEALAEASARAGGPVTLVGACSGSFHAMELSMRAPQYIKELVLVEPFGYTPWFLKFFVIPGVGYGTLRSVFGTDVGRFLLGKGMAAVGIMGEYNPIAAFALVRPRDIHAYLSMYVQVERRGAEYFRPLAMPKRLFHGTRTFAAVTDSLLIWRDLWGEIEVTTIQDVGHQITQDAPQQLVDLLFR